MKTSLIINSFVGWFTAAIVVRKSYGIASFVATSSYLGVRMFSVFVSAFASFHDSFKIDFLVHNPNAWYSCDEDISEE